MTNISSLLSRLLALCKPSEDIETIHFQAVAALSLEISLAPLVEELGLNFLIYVKSYKVLILIVFVHEVHRVTIPSSERIPFSLSGVISHDLRKFVNLFLEIFHVFGAVLDFLDSIFGPHVESLTEYLKEELGSQKSHMGFVGSNNLISLVVHTINIILISIVELIHLSNKIISLICESSQILFKPALLVLRVHGSLTHHF